MLSEAGSKKCRACIHDQADWKWLEGEALYVEMLNQLGIFEGGMKGKAFKDVKDDLFNFQFISK